VVVKLLTNLYLNRGKKVFTVTPGKALRPLFGCIKEEKVSKGVGEVLQQAEL